MGKNRNHSESHKYKWKENVLILKDICFECGSDSDIHYHHIIPESRGGNKTIPLCIVCHGKVHNKDFLAMRELQRIGLKKAKEKGVRFGRPHDSKESEDDFLSKEKPRKILELLSQEKSLREIANTVGCSMNLVVKVKRLKGITYVSKHPYKPSKYTKEHLHQEALKYSKRSHFKMGCNGGYKIACKNGWLDEICSHM